MTDALQTDLEALRRKVGEEGVLLPYQRAYLQAARGQQLVVVEKSRRIGMTWAEAGDDVVYAATRRPHGDDVSYIGFNLEMAREYIDAAAQWARALGHVCGEVGEFLFDQDGKGDAADRHIKAFRIDFASGNSIVALSSKPRSLRGRRGRVVIDEAAFHDDLDGMLKAALALTVWGGHVRVLSTHDGASNPFNKLVGDVRAGRRKGVVVRVTFEDAVADGLYERVCLVRGREPSEEGRAEWIAGIRDPMGEDAREELDVIPAMGSGAWLPVALLEARAHACPVVAVRRPSEFTLQSKHVREADIEAAIAADIRPVLDALDARREHAVGSDFARSGDQSVIHVSEIGRDLVRRPVLAIEMEKVPYEQQRQIMFAVLRGVPRLRRAALDASGNGGYLAEVAMQTFGTVVMAVTFSTGWYRDHTPAFKANITDGTTLVPKDADTIEDLHMFKVVDGVATMPKKRRKSNSGRWRHGDAGIAALLCDFAARQDPVTIEHAEGESRPSAVPTRTDSSTGFGIVRRVAESFGFHY